MKNILARNPIKTVLTMILIGITIFIGARLMSTKLTTADMNPEYTHDWVDLCVGRFTMKVPKDFVNDKMVLGFVFDNYQISQLPGDYSEARFKALIAQTEAEVAQKGVLFEGSENPVFRDEEPRNFSIGYRTSTAVPRSIKIVGYKLIGNKVIKIHKMTGDGYGEKDPILKAQHMGFLSKSRKTGHRIFNLLTPLKTSRQSTKGFCISNQVILAGEPEKKGNEVAVMTLGGRYNLEGSAYGQIRIDLSADARRAMDLPLRNMLLAEVIAGRANKINSNGIVGVNYYETYRSFPSGKTFVWLGLDSEDQNIYKPDIEIEVGLDHEDERTKEEMETFFISFLASFKHRD